MKTIALALVTALLAIGLTAAPADARETSWGCPSCRVGGR